MSVNRRARMDAMEPVAYPTWLVVENQFNEQLVVQMLPAETDPVIVMIEQLSKSVRLGFKVEELPGTLPLYWCHKDHERVSVKIVTRDPADKGERLRAMPPSVKGLKV